MIVLGDGCTAVTYAQVVHGHTTPNIWFDECTTTADPWYEVKNYCDFTDFTTTVDDKEAHRLKMESIPGKFKPVVIRPPSPRQQFRSKKLYECRRRNHSF